MNISVQDDRWEIYLANPNPRSYKGFRIIDLIKEKPGDAQLSFSNGDESFTVNEKCIENAFIKGFDIIDTISD